MAYHGEGAMLAAGTGHCQLGLAHQIIDPDERDQRRILEQHQPLVTQAGQGVTPGLGQDDAHEGVRRRQTQRLGRLALSLGHRLEGGAQRLGGVGGKQQRQSQHTTPEGAHLHVLAGQQEQHL